MAKPLIAFWKDGLYPQLRPFYDQAIARGEIQEAGTLSLQDQHLMFQTPDGAVQEGLALHYVAAGAQYRFFTFQAPLLAHGIPSDRIIDGCVFTVPGLDVPRFLAERIAYGKLGIGRSVPFNTRAILSVPQTLKSSSVSLRIGRLSYIGASHIEGSGDIQIQDFCSLSWDITFELGLNANHNHQRVSTSVIYVDESWHDIAPYPLLKGKIQIGPDVWFGRGCHLKSSASRPLVIGAGAVIASDSNVVSDVPPYAIVGGNPARFIKWRFPEKIREALLQICWWDWPLEKINAARHEMSHPEAFVEKYL